MLNIILYYKCAQKANVFAKEIDGKSILVGTYKNGSRDLSKKPFAGGKRIFGKVELISQ